MQMLRRDRCFYFPVILIDFHPPYESNSVSVY